jgi:hypothetical protein
MSCSRPALLLALLSAAGCLDTPPAAVVTGDAASSDARTSGDGGTELCAGLDRLVESFDEADAVPVFEALWDPGTAVYQVDGGALTMTGGAEESQINSLDYYERAGTFQLEEVTTSGANGSVSFSVYGEGGTARITISDDVIDLYSGTSSTSADRDPAYAYFQIGFSSGAVVFAASADTDGWTVLATWPDDMTGAVRAAIAVRNATASTTLTLGGINTASTCQ